MGKSNHKKTSGGNLNADHCSAGEDLIRTWIGTWPAIKDFIGLIVFSKISDAGPLVFKSYFNRGEVVPEYPHDFGDVAHLHSERDKDGSRERLRE